jgi:hypothetical protein
MREKLLQFLRMLERAMVPPVGCHHSLTYSLYEGEEFLCLQVWMPGPRTFFLVDGDLERPAEDLVSEILELCKEPA